MALIVGTLIGLTLGLWGQFSAGAGEAPGAPAQAKQKTPAAGKADPFFTGKPLTLDWLLSAVNAIPQDRLRRAIESRGVDFQAARDVLDRLRKAGASEELVRVISRKTAPAAPPPAPPKAKEQRAGPLTVECTPPECDVLVNGVSKGMTQGSSKVITDIPAGKVFLEAKKEGYEGQQLALNLQPGVPVRSTLALTPTLSTREKFGTELFSRMIQALGSEAGLREVRSLAATGAAILWDHSGARTDWTVTARLQLPNMVYWEVRGAGVNWWVSQVGEQSRAGGSGKLKGSGVAMEMEKNIREFLAYQLGAVVDRIRNDKMRLLANAVQASGSEGLALRAQGGTGTYNITLAQDLAPSRIVYEAASGLGSGLQVLYSDYRAAGQARYPTTFTIKFSDAPQHGMEIRLTKLEPNAKLRDRDFRR